MRTEVQVMRVIRVPPLGKLVVEVDKQRYEKLSEVGDENLKRLLLAAIGELIGFAEGYQNLVDVGVAPPLAAASPAAPQSEASIAAQQEKFLASLERERDTLRSAPSARPRFQVLGGTPPRLEPEPIPPSAGGKNLSVVEQIDAILQKHLAVHPDLAGHSVRLQQDPSGGLRVWVDNQSYQSPKEIQDPRIQQLIKKALKEWENS